MLRSSRRQQVIEGKENAVTINTTKNFQAAKTQGSNALRDLTNKTPHLKTVKFGDVDKKKVEKKKMKAKKTHDDDDDDDDVPDIEYCPPSVKGLN